MEKLGQTSKTLEKGTSNDVENPLNDLIKPVRTLWIAPSEKKLLKIIKDIRFKARLHILEIDPLHFFFHFRAFALVRNGAIAYFLLDVNILLSHLL